MGLETATYIADFQPSNPTSTDLRSQGDDHIRMIKQVLQNQFPTASRPQPIDRWVNKSANYTVLSTDDRVFFTADTSGGAFSFTLPSLAVGDAGWNISICKFTNDVNPYFIVPASGTVLSGHYNVAKARRAIPGTVTKVVWTGTLWLISRASELPIGAMVDYDSATLPPGYEWPNGQTLSSSANYPEYFVAKGSGATLDLRGRSTITLDNLGGSSAGRLGGGVITGTAVGNSGGVDVVTLTTGQIPSHTHANTLSESPHSHGGVITGSGGLYTSPGGATIVVQSLAGGSTAAVTTGISINNVAAGGGGSHSNLQPSIMCSKILVVE